MDQQQIFTFLVKYAIYGLVGFCTLIGILFASMESETLKLMPVGKRWATQLNGLLIAYLIAGFITSKNNLSPWLLCIIGTCCGIGGIWFVNQINNFFKTSRNVPVFIAKLKKLLVAFEEIFINPKEPTDP